MRHQKNRHKLGRTKAHRKRTLQALSGALIEHKRIRTTEAKAKALRPFIEPLITRARQDTQHNRRQVFRRLQNKWAVDALFNDVAVEVGERPGGYTRVIKLGRRPGDAARMAMIELVDYNDVQPEGAASGGGSRTRRGGGRGRRRRSQSASEESTSQENASEEEQNQTAAAPQQEQEAAGARADEPSADEPSAEQAAAEQQAAQAERTPPAEADAEAEAEPQNEADERQSEEKNA